MKFDWELLVIWLGLMVLIGIPIEIYISPFPLAFVMMFALGVVLTASFLRWGMK